MQLAAARYLEGVRILGVLDTQADVGIQLAEQTVAQMTGGHVFPLLTGERAVVDDEVHRDRRLGNFLERDRLRRVYSTDRIADVQVFKPSNS